MRRVSGYRKTILLAPTAAIFSIARMYEALKICSDICPYHGLDVICMWAVTSFCDAFVCDCVEDVKLPIEILFL